MFETHDSLQNRKCHCEFKSILQKEIGLDELKNPIQGNYTSATPPATTTTNTDDYSLATTTIPQDPQAAMIATPEVSLEDIGDTIATPAVTMKQDDNLKRTM